MPQFRFYSAFRANLDILGEASPERVKFAHARHLVNHKDE
jgi:hypothetical protein